MEFQRYQHIERVGTPEVSGIEEGMCYIFPKIDGTNASLWWENVLCAGSRNRQLTLDYDNKGFMAWAVSQQNIYNFFHDCPHLRLYGEWLVPHTLKTYSKDAWSKFYVFDVVNEHGVYLHYDDYKLILDYYNIEYIPPICKIDHPTYDRVVAQLEKNGYLIEDGKGVGEGVVIKRYDYVNRYGRTTWAKVVANEFKAKHHKEKTPELKEKAIVEQAIVDKFVTKTLVEKEFAKIEEWSSKKIPQLLNTVFYCLIKEESWEIIKDFNRPIIDYKRLYAFTVSKTKELLPQIF